jgi:hypothetical protein
MISAGEVGAIFEIQNNASATLLALMEQFEALQTKVDAAQEAMRSIAFPSGLLGEVTALDDKLMSIGESANKGAEAARAGFASIDESVGATATAVARLKREMAGLGAGMGGSHAIGPGGQAIPHAGGGGGRGGMFGHGGAHSPLHAMLHPIGHGIGLPSAMMNTAFGPEGLALAGVGYAGVKSVEDGARLQGEAVNMAIGGVSQDEIAKTVADSIRLGNKYGFDADKVMKVFNEVRAPLSAGQNPDSGIEAARGIADSLMQFAVVARRVGGQEKGGAALDQLYGAVKSGEMRNVLGSDDYAKFISHEGQIYAATGGRVAPTDMLQAISKAKAEGMIMDDDFVHFHLPAYVQEFGGAPTGTMFARAYSAFIGGHQTKKSKLEGQKVGLYDDDLQFKFQDDFLHNPSEAFRKMGDALKAHGFDSEEEMAKEIGKIASNTNVGELIAKSIMGLPQLQRTENAIRGAQSGADAAKTLMDTDPAQAWNRVLAGITNLGAAFTGPQMSGITAGLNSFADSLNSAIGPTKSFAEGLVSLQAWFDRNNMLAREKADTPEKRKADEDAIAGKSFVDTLKYIWNGPQVAPAGNPLWNGGGPGASFKGAAPLPVVIVGGINGEAAHHALLDHNLGDGPPGRQFAGRDPRSPSTGPYAYTPPTSPVVMPPPPKVEIHNDIKTDVKMGNTSVSVTLNGAAIAAAVATHIGGIIEKETRVATGIAAHDGQASYRIPDQGGIRHQ